MPLTRVLLLGDSMIATGFGVKLESLLDKTAGIVAYRKGKSASGLARPDFYDWMSEGRHQALAREPDVVIVMLGGNDGQDLTTNGPSKRRVRWGSEAWNDAYAARVDRLLARVWALVARSSGWAFPAWTSRASSESSSSSGTSRRRAWRRTLVASVGDHAISPEY